MRAEPISEPEAALASVLADDHLGAVDGDGRQLAEFRRVERARQRQREARSSRSLVLLRQRRMAIEEGRNCRAIAPAGDRADGKRGQQLAASQDSHGSEFARTATLAHFHFRVAFGLVGVTRHDGSLARGRHRPSAARATGRRGAGRPPPSEHADLTKAGRRARRWWRVDFGPRDPCRGDRLCRCMPRTRPSWKPAPSRRASGRVRKPSAASRRAQFGGRRSVPRRPISAGARRRRQAHPHLRPWTRYTL